MKIFYVASLCMIAYNMRVRMKTKFGKYPYVSGDFKPVERRKNVSSYGKSGRGESGMGH